MLAGYERVDAVDDRGQVAVRGDIVDVFPSTGQTPLRIELFGDEIERLSTYSLFTQRSLEPLAHAVIYPAAERLAHDADLEAWERDEDGRQPVPSGLVPLLDELAAQAALAVWEPGPVAASALEHLEEVGAHLKPAERGKAYARGDEMAALIARAGRLDPLASAPTRLEGQRPALAGRGLSESENELRGLVSSGLRVLVAFPHRGDAERAILGLRRVDARVLDADDFLPPGARRLLLRLARHAAGSSRRRSVSRCCPPRRSSAAARGRRPRCASVVRSRASPTCVPAITSCTRITASGSSCAST